MGFLTTQRRRAPEMFTLPGERSSQALFLPWPFLRTRLGGVHEPPIQATATLVGVRRPGVYDARLPNGKLTCAHLAKALAEEVTSFALGDRVTLELTPYDFESARITARIEESPRK